MINVLIIDETPLICSVMTSILNDEADIDVVACAHNTEGAQEHAEACDIALLSTSMPDGVALKLTRLLTAAKAEVKVVAIGMGESEEAILRYVEAGIAGYVLRDDSVEALIDKIRAISRGEATISPKMAAALMERVAELTELCDDENEDDALTALTQREREVMKLLEQNLTNQQIANELVIEVGTVKNHVHNILSKLNLSSRREVVARANKR